MKITIKEVAKKAQVSIATVSRVLNNLPGYLPETKQKVLEAIEELGYTPDNSARVLAGKSNKTLGIIIPKLSSLVATTILTGIEDAAHQIDHSVIVCNTDNNGKRTMKYLELLQSKRVDGLIIISEFLKDEYIEKIKRMNLPVVLIATRDLSNNFIHLKIDDKQAAMDATQYLIDNNHCKIAMLAGTRDDQITGHPRVEGFISAMQKNNLEVGEKNLIYGDFSFKSGIDCFAKIRKSYPDVTAIFAASDEMAVGVLNAAYHSGLKIPRDLSVIGFDNTQLAAMSIPPLTTVNQNFYQMAQEGVNMLMELMKGKELESKTMQHNIIERDSVKKIL